MDVVKSEEDAFEEDLLELAASEDIIDMEREMGFGEGEDWEHESNKPTSVKMMPAGEYLHSSSNPLTPKEKQATEKPMVKIDTNGRMEGATMRMMSMDTGSESHAPGEKGEILGASIDGKNTKKQHSQRTHYNDVNNVGMQADVAYCEKTSEFDQVDEQASALPKKQKKAGKASSVRASLESGKVERLTGNFRKGSDAKERLTKGCQQQQDPPWRFGRMRLGENIGCNTDKRPNGSKTGSFLTRKEAPRTSREARKEVFILDIDRPIEEVKSVRSAQEKIDNLEGVLLKQQHIFVGMKLALGTHATQDFGKLRQLVDAAERNLKKVSLKKPTVMTSTIAESGGAHKNRSEQMNKLKVQCKLLEDDREMIKLKIRAMLEGSKKGGQNGVETSPSDRERLLEHKVRELECSLQDWESKLKKIQAEFTAERGAWEESVNACQLDWENEKHRLVTQLKEQEAELSNLTCGQEGLICSLLSCRQHLIEVKNEASAMQEHGRKPRKATTPKEGCIKINHGLTPSNEDDACFVKQISAIDVTLSLQAEIEKLRELLSSTQGNSGLSPKGAKIKSQQLKEESQALDKRVSQTLSLLEELKHEMKVKELKVNEENEAVTRMVVQKVEQVEMLEKQLTEKNQDMDAIMQELQDEICVLKKDMEEERNEKTQFLDMKRKLIKGLQKRDQAWQEEAKMLEHKLDDMTSDIALKDNKLKILREELQEKDHRLDSEKERLHMAIKEVKQKAAKTILRFMHGKENVLQERLRERRRASKINDDTKGKDGKEEYAYTWSRTAQKRYSEKPRLLDMNSGRELQQHEDAKLVKCEDAVKRRVDKVAEQACDGEEEDFKRKGLEWVGRKRTYKKRGGRTLTILQDILQHGRDKESTAMD